MGNYVTELNREGRKLDEKHMPKAELSDIAQDLLIERALTQQLKDTLSERESHICDLSQALKTSQTELKKQRDGFDVDVQNINTLCTELLEICCASPINEAEARRRALALKRIATVRMQ